MVVFCERGRLSVINIASSRTIAINFERKSKSINIPYLVSATDEFNPWSPLTGNQHSSEKPPQLTIQPWMQIPNRFSNQSTLYMRVNASKRTYKIRTCDTRTSVTFLRFINELIYAADVEKHYHNFISQLDWRRNISFPIQPQRSSSPLSRQKKSKIRSKEAKDRLEFVFEMIKRKTQNFNGFFSFFQRQKQNIQMSFIILNLYFGGLCLSPHYLVLKC